MYNVYIKSLYKKHFMVQLFQTEPHVKHTL